MKNYLFYICYGFCGILCFATDEKFLHRWWFVTAFSLIAAFNVMMDVSSARKARRVKEAEEAEERRRITNARLDEVDRQRIQRAIYDRQTQESIILSNAARNFYPFAAGKPLHL